MKTYLVLIAAFLTTAVFSQQSYTYLFANAPFTSVPAGGPQLETIGTVQPGVTVAIPPTTCPDTPAIELAHFDFNAGFKASSFFSGTYSIEMIFKFDELSGYNRIIDFSNSTSDYGIYTYGDCLNFYPTGNIGTCPGAFDTTNYFQIVITRNDTTKEMLVFLNGMQFTSHMDVTDYYVIQNAPNDSIKFFRDDNVVVNEASSGNVALIRMTDYVLTPAEVTASYNDFCVRIISDVETPSMDSPVSFYPNPTSGDVTIAVKDNENYKITVMNSQGAVVFTSNASGKSTLSLKEYQDGIYFIRVTDESKYYSSTIIKESVR